MPQSARARHSITVAIAIAQRCTLHLFDVIAGEHPSAPAGGALPPPIRLLGHDFHNVALLERQLIVLSGFVVVQSAARGRWTARRLCGHRRRGDYTGAGPRLLREGRRRDRATERRCRGSGPAAPAADGREAERGPVLGSRRVHARDGAHSRQLRRTVLEQLRLSLHEGTKRVNDHELARLQELCAVEHALVGAVLQLGLGLRKLGLLLVKFTRVRRRFLF
mmetsp:Transcript_7149/g.19759  ORF Transcript_7149/g.19759 Transcript_7149/m.19759 type:complete len:221 (+) Transcript_7149:185-847(+)